MRGNPALQGRGGGHVVRARASRAALYVSIAMRIVEACIKRQYMQTAPAYLTIRYTMYGARRDAPRERIAISLKAVTELKTRAITSRASMKE